MFYSAPENPSTVWNTLWTHIQALHARIKAAQNHQHPACFSLGKLFFFFFYLVAYCTTVRCAFPQYHGSLNWGTSVIKTKGIEPSWVIWKSEKRLCHSTRRYKQRLEQDTVEVYLSLLWTSSITVSLSLKKRNYPGFVAGTWFGHFGFYNLLQPESWM